MIYWYSNSIQEPQIINKGIKTETEHHHPRKCLYSRKEELTCHIIIQEPKLLRNEFRLKPSPSKKPPLRQKRKANTMYWRIPAAFKNHKIEEGMANAGKEPKNLETNSFSRN